MKSTPLISFIMPAKNVSTFIEMAIRGIINQSMNDWELIIIEDNSDDDTYEVAQSLIDNDDRIQLHKNTGKGKVSALNDGYEYTSASLIKCIDADDILHKNFIEYCIEYEFDAFCHSYYSISLDNKLIGIGNMNDMFIRADYNHCINNLIGMARWTWTIKRSIGNKIFPMPKDLPYEDMWFSLIIKKHCYNILNIKIPLYYYRQHTKQTYGGIYNYSKNIILYRSLRKLTLINALENNKHRLVDYNVNICINRAPYKLITEKNSSLLNLLNSNMPFKSKLKYFVLINIPILISIVKILRHSKFGLVHFGSTYIEYKKGKKHI